MQLEFQWPSSSGKIIDELKSLSELRQMIYKMRSNQLKGFKCKLNDQDSKIIQCIMAHCGCASKEHLDYLYCVELNNSLWSSGMLNKQYDISEGIMTDCRINALLQRNIIAANKVFRHMPSVSESVRQNYIVCHVDNFRDFAVFEVQQQNIESSKEKLFKHIVQGDQINYPVDSVFNSCIYRSIRHRMTLRQAVRALETSVPVSVVYDLMQLLSNEWIFNPFWYEGKSVKCINTGQIQLPANLVDMSKEKLLQYFTLYRRNLFNSCTFASQGDISNMYIASEHQQYLAQFNKWYLQQDIKGAIPEPQVPLHFILEKNKLSIVPVQKCGYTATCSDSVKDSNGGLILKDINHEELNNLYLGIRQEPGIIQANRILQKYKLPQWQHDPVEQLRKQYGMSSYVAAICMLLRFQQVAKKSAELSWYVNQNKDNEQALCKRIDKQYKNQPKLLQASKISGALYDIQPITNNHMMQKMLDERLTRIPHIEQQSDFYPAFRIKGSYQPVELASYYAARIHIYCPLCKFDQYISVNLPIEQSVDSILQSSIVHCSICSKQCNIIDYQCILPNYCLMQMQLMAGTAAPSMGIVYKHGPKEDYIYEYLACNMSTKHTNIVVQKIGNSIYIWETRGQCFLEDHLCYSSQSVKDVYIKLKAAKTAHEANQYFAHIISLVQSYHNIDETQTKQWVSGRLVPVGYIINNQTNIRQAIMGANQQLSSQGESLQMLQICAYQSIYLKYNIGNSSEACIVDFNRQTVKYYGTNATSQARIATAIFNKPDSMPNLPTNMVPVSQPPRQLTDQQKQIIQQIRQHGPQKIIRQPVVADLVNSTDSQTYSGRSQSISFDDISPVNHTQLHDNRPKNISTYMQSSIDTPTDKNQKTLNMQDYQQDLAKFMTELNNQDGAFVDVPLDAPSYQHHRESVRSDSSENAIISDPVSDRFVSNDNSMYNYKFFNQPQAYHDLDN